MKRLCSLIIVALVCVTVLSAYGEKQTKTYEGDVSGERVLTSITYKDDKVSRQSTINTIKYSDLGVDRDEAKKLFAKSESIFKDLGDVEYKVDYEDKEAIEHLDVDYTEVDVKKLDRRLGVSTEENRDISFEKLEKQLKHRDLKEEDKMGNK